MMTALMEIGKCSIVLKSILNFPVEAAFFRSLVEDESDLQLMMPSADLPFNESQWISRIEASAGSLSFKVTLNQILVGHYAFLRINRELKESTLGLIYLASKLRGTGASRELIELAERTAIDLLDLKTLLLNVRSFNQPAYKLYLGRNYVEYERANALIRMRKTLQL